MNFDHFVESCLYVTLTLGVLATTLLLLLLLFRYTVYVRIECVTWI
jgi:hypothetical protein